MYPKILIFGFGYTANFLAKKLAALGFHVVGTSRNKERRQQYNEMACELIDFTRRAVEKNLQSATHILISVPPSAQSGDPVLFDFVELVKKYTPKSQWVGYLSSTGVYGDHQGGWVVESSASINLGQQAQLRLAAEQAWTALANDCQLPLHIFRIAGIYGPHRNALNRIAQGKAQVIYKENHFFSRIHVEDIAAILVASIQNPNPLSIYNVADDEPAPAYVVDEYASHLLNLPLPVKVPFEAASLSPMAKEFYTHHRRVSNAKIKRELLPNLNYPTFREGLMKLYDSEEY